MNLSQTQSNVATCLCCTLADNMKDCPLCKFNAGLKFKPQLIGWNSGIDWHNRILFDVPAMAKNTDARMKPLKAKIDARMQAAAQRANDAFHHK